jgi:hypothetical protein
MSVDGYAEGSIAMEWNGVDSRRRRIILEPRGAGGWLRVSERFDGKKWVHCGQEIVADVSLDAPAAVIRDGGEVIGN